MILQSIDTQATTVVFSIGGLVVAAIALVRFGMLAGRWDARFDEVDRRVRNIEERLPLLVTREEITARLERIEQLAAAIISKMNLPFQDREH